MDREDRAKQFLPFDSLKGLKEELIKREERRMYLEKPVLSEEKMAELSEEIKNADFSKEHTLTYYANGKIIKITDVFKIHAQKKVILYKDNKISFSDILLFI